VSFCTSLLPGKQRKNSFLVRIFQAQREKQNDNILLKNFIKDKKIKFKLQSL